MLRVAVVAIGLVLAIVALGARGQTPAYRSGTHAVSIYATVVDARGGQLVADLTQDDFTVLDDDVRQPISVFSNAVRPITVVIMLDRSASMRDNFDLEERATVQFVKHLAPTDRVRIGNFSNHIAIEPETFTSDEDTLLRILFEDLQGPGPTPLWAATAAAMSALPPDLDRRVVLVLTDGYDAPVDPEPSFEEIQTRAAAEEVMIYGIGLTDTCAGSMPFSRPLGLAQQRGKPLGRGSGEPGRRGGPLRLNDRTDCVSAKPDRRLSVLAASSGGGYVELQASDDLGEAFARIAEELHHQYLLGFTAATLDGRVHQLTVQVRGTALTARARKSYIASAGR